ncbi:MAG: AraC family transcriptional regulator, partial [Clostridia bacterium]|nr:AraC family transcriptional regulator [Clostridia bacterium]MBQ7573190.1 AraC family transcriptional regulator [Clostridia bacterium]
NSATELLNDGKSVTETAEILGFSSQAHLSKVYKKMMGKSPSQIKREG